LRPIKTCDFIGVGKIAMRKNHKFSFTEMKLHISTSNKRLNIRILSINVVRYHQQTVLPGGRNFGQKGSKRAEEKQSWPEEFTAEFWPNCTKSGRKGAREYFLKNFLINGANTLSKKKKNFNFISNCPFVCVLNGRFCQIGRTLSKIGRIFFLCTGRKTIFGPGNTASKQKTD
jgi:hypothetical protein